MKIILYSALFLVLTLNYGCAPVLVGGAAVGGYYVGKDERKAGATIVISSVL